MENVVIYGETAFAERIYSYIKCENEMNVISFTNAKAFKKKETIQDIPVVAFEDLDERFKGVEFSILIAIGYVQMNNIRKKIYKECKLAGYTIASYISKTAIIYQSKLGEGCIIMPNCYIGPQCNIGNGSILEACVNLSHDNKIGDFNFISTNTTLGGYASICNNCFVGLNSTIKSSICVNDYSLIGAGTNVLKSTESYSVNVGNPSHQLVGKNSLDSKI